MAYMKARIIVGALLAFTAGATFASDWQFVGISKLGAYQMDAASLVRDGDIVKAWARTIYVEPQDMPGSGKALSSRVRFAFDCSKRTSAVQELQYFESIDFENPVGTGGHVPDVLLDWSGAPPDSIAEGMLEFACSHAPPN